MGVLNREKQKEGERRGIKGRVPNSKGHLKDHTETKYSRSFLNIHIWMKSKWNNEIMGEIKIKRHLLPLNEISVPGMGDI